MFLAKLGAREDVSSRWPMRVSPGTQISTSTPSNTEMRPSRWPNDWSRRGLTKVTHLL